MKAVTGLVLGAILLLSLTTVVAQNNCNLRSRIVTYQYWINYPYTYGTYQVLEYYCDFSEHPSSLPDGLLRLADQDTQAHHVEGRPEVYHSGEWGTICNNGWDSNDAHAVCQQLGFSGPDQTCCSSQGSGTGRVWLENLQCDITDDWISQECDVSTWGSTCDHSQDAGVRCERAPRVRLVNGDDVNILRGRVEYRYGNAWGKVCDDYWDEQDSQVVCHQLGFGSHTSFTTHTTTPRTIDAFGVDYGAYFLMDNLFCFGSEIALHHCAQNGWENHNCLYYEVVGVYCSMPLPRVSAGGSSSSSLHVTLEMLEGLQYSVTIIGYQVEYRESGSSEWIPKIVDATSYRHSFNLTELNAYTTYQIRAAVMVQEFMATESLVFSDVLHATTFEGAPGPVSSLSVVTASATSISITWDEPAQTNGRISDYVITYTSLTDGIPHSGKIVTDSSARTYTLTGLQEYTLYLVTILARTAVAEGMETSGQATTAEAAPSGSPNAVEAIPQGPNSIQLSWGPPDFIRQNGPITGYVVMYSSGGDISNMITPDNMTVFILDGLQPYTTYNISVAAVNSEGRGPFSASVEQATFEAAPSGPPLNVSLIVLSAESMQVTWQSLSLDNGQVSSYTIHWGQSHSNPGVLVVQGDAVSYRIPGLSPFTIYHARVAASTRGGQGPFSSWSTAMTLTAAPTAAPLNISVVGIRSTSADVTWLIPPEGTRNGHIIAYMIVFGLTTGDAPLGGAQVSDSLRYTVTNLQPHTQFYVKVAAKTSAGVGPYSGNRTFNTLSDVPGTAPSNVSLVSDQDQAAITVSWAPLPSQYYNSDELEGYLIHYEASNVRVNSSGDMMVGPSTTTRILTGLHERVAYTISVAAVNAKGTGPYSSEQTVTTSGQVPESAPLGVSATATSSSSIRVEWSSPLVPDHQLPILSYTVSYQLTGLSAGPMNQTVTSVEGATHTTDIPGLEAYRQYVITVYSNNREGSSPPSDAVTVRTHSDTPLFAPNFTLPLVLNTSITLTWQPLTEEQARGNVAQYHINWSGGAPLMLGPDATSHVFSVEPSTAYNFSIATSTLGGTGPYSDPFSITSLDGIPTTPRDFRARALTSTAIQLTWHAPSSPNGAYVYLITIIVEGDTNVSISEIQAKSSLTEYTVDGLEENTFYEFFLNAVTSAGKGERVIARAQTLEAPPSSPPLNVTAVAINATAITVSWETPPVIHHNGDLTGFRVLYRNTVLGSSAKELEVSSPEQLSITVPRLTPYTSYSVKVAVVNTVDTGPYSKDVSVQTWKSEPSQPRGLSIIVVSSTQLNVSWNQPDYPNGIFLGYTLRFEASYPPDIDNSGEELPGPDATHLLVVDLHPGTSYNIYLLARNDFGMSKRVDGTGYTRPEVPTAAPLVSASALSSTTLMVTWSPPATTTWKGTIQELHLRYGLVVNNETEDTMEQRMPIAVSLLAQPNDIAGSVNITGLMAFTEYYVIMSLVNDAGEGPYSDGTNTMTLQGLPSTVRDLTVYVNHTNITATWSTPADVNGELLYYKVYLDNAFRERVPSSSYKITIDSLEPRSQHNVTVSAVTGAGEGKTSTITFQTGDAPIVTGNTGRQTAEANSQSSLLYLLIGAAVAMVLIVAVIVLLLGVIAWKRINAAKASKHPGYALDTLALYDDDAFAADREGYQVQENPFSAKKVEAYAEASGMNPLFQEMEAESGAYKGHLADLEKALADYQSGEYYESGKKSDKKSFF